MLNNVSINIEYYDAVTDETLESILSDEEIPIQVKILMSAIMIDFSQKIKNKLFGKMEDK